ncbi:hypothetical protein NBO_2g0069 [Nosema bombycis CQ1]|uniref:Uncharacterized protein n=1 Tax=Nosema bombycis (strain CQ1 / CVCC 102059) TaxID=578461 RepID=R0MRP6_NOSB1|nr:hypothetical protein NBO_2g0069 [Nosema bombycis CQ1]|eukprot:EOB15578.1 hypothetical protein NBO_2g0069 [Nosema bombycis CQ1]
MDPNNAKSLNIDSFGQELEKYMDFAELVHKTDTPILNYEEVKSKLSRLEELSETINPDGSKSLEPGQLEKQLEKFHKLSQIIDQKGLQYIKTDKITNELEKLNGLVKACDLNGHENLTFHQIEQKLNEISDLAKVINPEQQHSIKLEEIEGKLKNHIESAKLTTTQQTLISDGNGAEKEELIKTVEQIQNNSLGTVIKEDFQKEMIKEIKETNIEKSYSEIPVKDFQKESADIGRFIEPYISENLKNTKFEYTIPVNYQGDDPNVYTFSDVGTSQVFIQPGDFKKNIKKFQELVKTIKSEIETFTVGDLKNKLPEEILKLMDLREVETLNPVDLENKIEMLYNFAESLKNKSSSAEDDRAQKNENLDRFIDKNVTITSNYEDGKLEKEVHRANNNINNKSGKNRLANSENGQNKKKSLTQTKSSTKSEDKRIKSLNNSQKSLQAIKKNTKDGSITKLFDEFSHDQDKKSKMSNKKLQSITNVPVKNDLENDEFKKNDLPYGDDPNVYNSVEIAPNLIENTTDVSLNKNEQFQSSKLESVFYNPKKLSSARNHEDYGEENVFDKSQDNKLKVLGEKSKPHSQNDSDYHKKIRKFKVGELKPNTILNFTFSRSS